VPRGIVPAVRVAVLTTSYPRDTDDHAGRFVAEAVAHLRERGVEIAVVGPASYRHFGAAGPGGVMANVRRRPWAAPLLLASLVRATRRTARDADLVHAHWLPTAVAAAATGKPYVVTLHGSDVELARRAPALARRVLGRAAGVITVSSTLAEDARRLGAREPRVVPNGVDFPAERGREASPPYVLYAGRLSREKGIEELVAAARGLRLVVAGDGPLRHLVPDDRGFVSRAELERLYAGAAVVACPSRREGFGVVCAEAMAHGRAVVATAVGGLTDLVVHEETGLLVPPRDPVALRGALDRLLADDDLRARLGAAARERVARLCSWDRVTDATLAVYREALGEQASTEPFSSA
jgi:glycosyltransferase involved in cell wall biosynthesis